MTPFGSGISATLVGTLTLLLGLPLQQVQGELSTLCSGIVRVLLPGRILPEQPQDLQFTVVKPLLEPITIKIFKSPSFDLDRDSATLKFGQPESVKLTMKAGAPGVVKVSIYARGCNPDYVDQPIDAGFAETTALVVDNHNLIAQSEESGAGSVPPGIGTVGQYFNLRLVDRMGNRLKLSMPITLQMKVQGDAEISVDGTNWTSSPPPMTIGEDAPGPGMLYVRSASPLSQDTGAIDVTAKMDAVRELSRWTLRYTTRYAWWVLLLAIMLGSIAYTIVETFLGCDRKASLFIKSFFGNLNVVVAMGLGLLGYALRESDLLGLKPESSTFTGHFVFGFLLGCLGLDGVYKKLKGLIDEKRTSANAPTGAAATGPALGPALPPLAAQPPASVVSGSPPRVAP